MNALCLVVALTLSAGDDPTLLTFTAPNCPACDAVKPAVARLVDAGAPIEFIDYAEQPQLCKQFKVTSFPTFVLVANGKEVDRIVGQTGYDRLVKLLAKAAPLANDSVAKATTAARRGEVVRAQSPDDAPKGLFGGALGRLWGAGGQPARRSESPARRDPFASGRGRSGGSNSSDETDIEIGRAPAGSSDSEQRGTPAMPVGKSGRRSSQPPAEDVAEDFSIDRDEPALERSAPSKTGSQRFAAATPSNRLRNSSTNNARTAAAKDEDTYRPTRGENTSDGDFSPQQRAIASTVRVKVIDSRGASDGSGVIIHTREDEALIATCGHIFRESQGHGRIMIDLFIPGAAPVEGKLVKYNIESDIALVQIWPGVDVVATPVAPVGYQFATGDRVFSVGCQRGQGPELIESSITGINRYKAPPHIVIQGAPVQGRSGGGLFSDEGYLIGICNAADKLGREGIFAGLPIIHGILDKTNLSEVYRQASPLTQDSAVAQTDFTEEVAPEMDRGMPEIDPAAIEGDDEPAYREAAAREVNARDRRQDKRADAGPRGARLGEPIVEVDEGEADIICIVRSRTNPGAQNDVLVIRQATPELLAQINQAAAPPPDASRPADNESAARIAGRPDQANRRSRPGGSSLRPRGPVVRGQSMR